MAKNSYGIRSSIDRSFLDHEISISGGGWELPSSPLRQILFIAGGVLLLGWVCMKTFVASSGVPFIIAVVLWGLVAVAYFGKLDKTRELNIQRVPALLAYLPASARRINTRRSSNPSDFYATVGITEIEENGRIHYIDGGIGQVYLVVGSASYMLFPGDKAAILDHNDAFWRKADAGYEISFITTKEPQRVYRQLAACEAHNRALEVRDPDLIELQNEQYDILRHHVGGNFPSIHQYALLRGKSADTFKRGQTLIEAEVEHSALMLKEATVLDREETIPLLRIFYRAVEEEMSSHGGAEAFSTAA